MPTASRDDLFKTKLCMLFSRGSCPRTACNFAHGSEELRGTVATRGGNIRFASLSPLQTLCHQEAEECQSLCTSSVLSTWKCFYVCEFLCVRVINAHVGAVSMAVLSVCFWVVTAAPRNVS